MRHRNLKFDALEDRRLLTVPGINDFGGMLLLQATKTSGNVADVSIDPGNGWVKATMNGQSEEFAPNQVNFVAYLSFGGGGGDTFSNNTAFDDTAFVLGNNNTVTSGSGTSVVFMFGDNGSPNNNTVHNHNSTYQVVYEMNGTGDVVDADTRGSQSVFVW